MRILIFTSSCGTAHDAAAFALRDWIEVRHPGYEVKVEDILLSSSFSTRLLVYLYNWIQVSLPLLHQLYWRLLEFEDVFKLGTVLFGRSYVIKLLREFRPDVIVSTHPHTNRGYFALAKHVLGPGVRCVCCCTELDGGFGFTRNWVTPRADLFWSMTEAVDLEVKRRRFPLTRLRRLGPLLHPAFYGANLSNSVTDELPVLVLSTGSNGANNHISLLQELLPQAGRIKVVALCGRRLAVKHQLLKWAESNPSFSIEVLGLQGPAQMASLYRRAWAMVARPGARTATEALVMSCPLIFNRYGVTMPQELLAPRWFKSHGLEISIRSPRELAVVVRRWLDEPSVYHQLRSSYLRYSLYSDPAMIVETVLHG